jgi:predicted DNA-binding transcriptional regulator AlpA
MGAMTRIDRIPAWPAMMTRQLAADYCSLSIAQFEREINAGRLPAPVSLGGVAHWHKPTLDRYLEQISGATYDWRKDSPLYAER